MRGSEVEKVMDELRAKSEPRRMECTLCGKKAVPSLEEQFLLASGKTMCSDCWKGDPKPPQ